MLFTEVEKYSTSRPLLSMWRGVPMAIGREVRYYTCALQRAFTQLPFLCLHHIYNQAGPREIPCPISFTIKRIIEFPEAALFNQVLHCLQQRPGLFFKAIG